MQSFPWGSDPLSYLIGDVAPADFFKNYHEQKALHCTHGQPERYSELLNFDRIDEIISTTELPPESVQMARSDPPISRSNFTFESGVIDRGAMIRHFQQGATIILQQLHFADALLANFCDALETVFSASAQTNVYLTPPNNQGFNTHYDDHDVFVMQISGRKHWKLYQKPIDNPYRGENFRPNMFEPGEVQYEFTLEAGDCVYIPRGLMHDAVSDNDTASLHITVGIVVKKWADLMLEAMSEVALRVPGFRSSLPPGFANQDFDRDQAREHFRELIESFKTEADFDEVFELFIENFLRSRGPNVRGALNASNTSFEPQQRYKRRVDNSLLLRYDDDEALLICGGGDIHFPRTAVAGLEAMVSGAEFNITAFADMDEDACLDSIKKLVAFGIIEKL